jgi:ferredoxin-NADP reductase
MMRDIMAEGEQLAEFRSPSRWFASMRDPPSALGKRALTGGSGKAPVVSICDQSTRCNRAQHTHKALRS